MREVSAKFTLVLGGVDAADIGVMGGFGARWPAPLTDTDFMKEVRGRIPLGDPKERTAGMIAEIDKFTMATSGTFVEWNGQGVPW